MKPLTKEKRCKPVDMIGVHPYVLETSENGMVFFYEDVLSAVNLLKQKINQKYKYYYDGGKFDKPETAYTIILNKIIDDCFPFTITSNHTGETTEEDVATLDERKPNTTSSVFNQKGLTEENV